MTGGSVPRCPPVVLPSGGRLLSRDTGVPLCPPGPLSKNRISRLKQQNEALREAFEERAAIMEFDGGLTREEAEREARRLTGYDGW